MTNDRQLTGPLFARVLNRAWIDISDIRHYHNQPNS